MGYNENIELLIKEVNENVLPTILFYSNEMCKQDGSITVKGGEMFALVCRDHYNQQSGESYIFTTPFGHMIEGNQIHYHSLDKIQALIKYCKKLKKEYDRPLKLLKECEEVDIKVCTRIILFEKIKK